MSLFFICRYSGQVSVRYGGIYRSSASPRPHCDGTPSASFWPSPRQTPGPSCLYPLDRTPPDATTKRVGAPSASMGILRQLRLYRHVARPSAEDPAHRVLSCRDPRGWTMPRGRPHASWLRQVEVHLRDMDMTVLASVWAMARRRPIWRIWA